ncbi:MAG: chemotaxis protein CheA [Ignavibacteriaceae bacterium]
METAVQDYPLLKDPEMKEILESFLIETREILEKLDVDLMELEKRADDQELLNQVFRSFHTIKGTSGFFGLNKLTSITHKCEDILNKLRKGEAKLNSGIMDSILLSYDKIRDLLVSIETNFNEDVNIDKALSELTKTLDSLEINVLNKTPDSKVKESPVKGKTKTKKPVKNSKTSKTVKKTKTSETIKNKTQGSVKEEKPASSNKTAEGLNIIKVVKEIDEEIEQEEFDENLTAVEEAKTETDEPNNPGNEKNAITRLKEIRQKDNTIRVDVERLDELLNIASELVLGRNRLAQVSSEFALEYEGTKLSRDLAEATRQIDLMMNELQLVVMKTRMVKIGKVFNRFPRVVRDLSKESRKNVKLELNGEETELDKTLIEEINDPLVHLIRNSIDHGIESPEERKKIGKDPAGTITLSAEHEGNHIIITIEDDGKGIDPEVIKEKAISKGLISKEKAKELTTNDAYNLIFLPGFSTAEIVTNISGRGVGMDVVKTNVTKLRGLINIESKVGAGTKIIIKLPLTLAIIPGMIVKVNEQSMVIPLNSITEVVRVHLDNINTISGREVIRMRDSVIPLLGIDELLNDVSYNKDKVWQYVVVVGIAEKRFGIKVDHLIGQKEIVIKSLGTYLGTIEGIAGSTILGDGTVIMILDIGELIHKLEV